MFTLVFLFVLNKTTRLVHPWLADLLSRQKHGRFFPSVLAAQTRFSFSSSPLFSTMIFLSTVLPPKTCGAFRQGWYRLHRDMLVHHEVNAYLAAATSWEKLLEVRSGELHDRFRFRRPTVQTLPLP